MKVVQTFYSYANSESVLQDSAGFLSPDMNWKSMALSCLLLKKHFGKVTLYCNHKVGRLVTDILKIPYTDVIEIPDFMDKYTGCNLWALPKVYTYAQQTGPFIHVDSDWFMFEKLSDNILKSDLIGQNIEYDDQMYNRRTFEKFMSNGCEFPYWAIKEFNTQPILRVVNAGILGGNDIDFIQSYVGIIKIFIQKNEQVLNRLNDGFINSLYEQFFFYLLAKNTNKVLGLCTEGDKLSTKFDWISMDLSHRPKTGYMHLLANLKRRYNTYVFVNQYLDYLSPKLSQRITRVCFESGIRPLISFPQWDIYASQNDAKSKHSIREHVNTEPAINHITSPVCMLENFLHENDVEISLDRRMNTNPLWEIHSLWQKNITFSIQKNIQISHITKEEAKLFIKNQSNNIVDNIGDKTYIVSIPDAMMMKVVSLLISGISADIIDCLRSIEDGTLEVILDYLIRMNRCTIESSDIFIQLDKIIRRMVVSGILRINL